MRLKQLYQAGSPRVSMYIIPIACWLVLRLQQGINNEFTLLSRMQTSQDLSNPTPKNLNSSDMQFLLLSVVVHGLKYEIYKQDKRYDQQQKRIAPERKADH